MSMKTRDYLAIFATARLMPFLEMLTCRITGKSNTNHFIKSTYTNNQELPAYTANDVQVSNGLPSPNGRCGFVTGTPY